MDRATLFYGALALYGIASAADAVVTVLSASLTVATGAPALAGLVVFGAGLYGLARPGQRGDAADSWLAYLVAVGALFAIVGLVVGRL
ncbi:hypothetical protein [Halorientalis salina]|uniref:hypothetical protein n=1 Tax=Halorientalis salina TaxID=2932266 RepID=UPI0010ABC1A8|nr:hypothetical protein [Halorientalis salina]